MFGIKKEGQPYKPNYPKWPISIYFMQYAGLNNKIYGIYIKSFGQPIIKLRYRPHFKDWYFWYWKQAPRTTIIKRRVMAQTAAKAYRDALKEFNASIQD